jgi:CHAD domain-containing protein
MNPMNDTEPTPQTDLTLAQSFVRAVREHLSRLREGERKIRDEADPEGVHLMRTSCRRLRATVKYLGHVLPRALRKSLGNSLRDLMESLGPVRDLDVLQQAVGSEAILAPDDREALQASLKKRSGRATDRMKAALEGESYRNLLAELDGAATVSDDGIPVTTIGPARIAQALAETVRLRPADWTTAPEERLHELRKSVKRMRYTLEAFAPAYGRPVARAIERCRALQESLGAIQDASAFGDLLKGARTFAAGQFLATARARARQEVENLAVLWEKAFGTKGSSRLGGHLFRRLVRKPRPAEEVPEQRAAV